MVRTVDYLGTYRQYGVCVRLKRRQNKRSLFGELIAEKQKIVAEALYSLRYSAQ